MWQCDSFISGVLCMTAGLIHMVWLIYTVWLINMTVWLIHMTVWLIHMTVWLIYTVWLITMTVWLIHMTVWLIYSVTHSFLVYCVWSWHMIGPIICQYHAQHTHTPVRCLRMICSLLKRSVARAPTGADRFVVTWCPLTTFVPARVKRLTPYIPLYHTKSEISETLCRT